MGRYLFRRFVQLIPLFFIVSFMTFGLMHLSPGGPEQIFLSGEDPTIRPEDIYILREKWGLNDPLPVQYAKWLGNVLQGDLGRSFASQRPVLETWMARLPASIQLNVVSFTLIYLLAIPLGVITAIRQHSWLDYSAQTFSFLGYAMPNFWVGLMLIIWVALPSGGLIPVHGYSTPDVTVETVGLLGFLGDRARYMFLPVFTIVMGGIASLTRYTRNAMLEVLKEDYIRTARAKGVHERIVIYKHALRNAMLPIVTISGAFVAGLFGGSVIIEKVFSWPGVGQLGVDAVGKKDHPVIMALLLFSFLVSTLVSFATEVIYVFVDPRIKYS